MTELLGKSTVKRRKAAQALQRVPQAGACKDLQAAIELEADSNNWMTMVELLRALAAQQCGSAADMVWQRFINGAEAHSMVSMAAATAYIRLSRKNLQDASAVLKLLEHPGYSVKEGALEALAYDRMIPDRTSQAKIIEMCFDMGSNRERGYTDPRYGLAAACAGWEPEVTERFLNHCIASDDAPLAHVAKNSLKGKYVRLR